MNLNALPTIRDGQGVAATYEELRAAILAGELQDGVVVSQAQLAERYGVGRTPLREALRLLQREGLVIASPNKRMQIAPLTAGEFEEISVARLALETVAVRITVPTLTSGDVARLKGLQAQMAHFQALDDLPSWNAPHRAFHHALVAGAGRRVSAEISELADHTERYRLRFSEVGNSDDGQTEHQLILAAVEAGDADLSAVRLAEHYVRNVMLVFSRLDPDHDLGRLRITLRTLTPDAELALKRD